MAEHVAHKNVCPLSFSPTETRTPISPQIVPSPAPRSRPDRTLTIGTVLYSDHAAKLKTDICRTKTSTTLIQLAIGFALLLVAY